MKKAKKALKTISIILVSAVIAHKLNFVIINIIEGSNNSTKNIEIIYIVEMIALAIAIIGIATNNYKRMFFGFGGYFIYTICGTIIQMLSAGQTMEIIDKVRLFINFTIVIVMALAMANAIKPFTTAAIVKIMVIVDITIGLSQILTSPRTTSDAIQALANIIATLGVGVAIVTTCPLVKNNHNKRIKVTNKITQQ